MAALTEVQVRAIRKSKKMGTVLAEKYGVDTATISRIKNRKSWKHIA